MGTDNFSSTMDTLIGFNVNLYVGEEIIKGKLMGVETDHVVIEDENKYVYYYNFDKIEAITKNTKQFKQDEITTEYVKTQSLRELLNSLKNAWVTILCLNKKTFSGVLSITDKDFVTLINGEQRILIKISHISNILKGEKKEEKAESNNTENASDSNEVKEDQSKTETTVLVNENKKASQQDNVKKVEKETSKVVISEPKKDSKVWSDSIKSDEKMVAVTSQKTKSEKKQQKEESSQSISKEVKQSKKEMKQTIEPKAQKTEAVQKLTMQDKEITQPVTYVSKEKKAPAKEIEHDSKSVKMEVLSQKEVKNKKHQELTSKIKSQTPETQPLMKITNPNKNSGVNKEPEVKPQLQEVAASRYVGEPASDRQFDRRSIFSGWPSRRNTPNRF